MARRRMHPKMKVLKAILREDGVLLVDQLPFKASQKVGVYVWSDRDILDWPGGPVPSNFVDKDLFSGSNKSE